MIFMPAVAAMMKQMPADKNPFGSGFDAEAPVLEMTQELAEMSTAPISDKVFEIPEGYTTAPLGEIIKGMMPKPTGAAKP